MTIRVLWAVATLFTIASARSVREAQSKNFMGEGTDSLAVSLFQSEGKTNTNLVFSPLGFSTILAILAEGARENTRNQLVSALKLPEDTYALRSTFKSVLENMQEHMVLNKPEFKNWFYVYKNYTVEESYRVVLKDNYLTEVKEIENYDLEESESKDRVIAALTEAKNPSPAVQQPVLERVEEDKKKVSSEEKGSGVEKLSETGEKDSSEEKKDKKKNNEKDSSEEKEDKKKNKEKDSSEEKDDKKKIKEKDSSEEKDDKMKNKEKDSSDEKDDKKKNKEKDSSEEKDDEEKVNKTKDSSEETKKKYVEIPAKNEKLEEDENKAVEEVDEDPKPVRHEAENIIKESESKKEAEKESVKKTLEKLAMEDIVARSFSSGKQVEKEVLTALSANRLSSVDNATEKKTVSRMIIFNALYYRGNWSVPFVVNKEPQSFYLSEADKVTVDVMSANGEFPIGQIPELGASAVELPYQGEKYSLLVVLPNERNGLDDVIAKLSNYSITDISNKLTKQPSEVSIPKFGFYSITRPKDALVKCGITDIFNESADLSGITGTKGLFLEDLVQLVTIEVESSSSSFNWLTTSNVNDLGRTEPLKFSADHPFFFALRDRVENVIVVAGKVLDPRKKDLMKMSNH